MLEFEQMVSMVIYTVVPMGIVVLGCLIGIKVIEWLSARSVEKK